MNPEFMLGELAVENDELRAILREIHRICHIPSGSRYAYTHFQADFDQIRGLTAPYTTTP